MARDMVFRGDWVYCADYEPGDVVRCGGNTYMAIQQSAGKEPGDPLNAAFWDSIGGLPEVPDHNDLDGIQGGDADEMYHATSDEYDAIHGANAPSASNPFATRDDVVTHHNELEGIQGGTAGERYHLKGNAAEAAEHAKNPSSGNPFLTRGELPILDRTISPFVLAYTPAGTGMLYGAAYGDGLHLAVGDNCAVHATSDDPEHWTADLNVPAGYWRDVAFGGLGIFAAVGMDGRSMWRDAAGEWTLNPVLGGDWKKIVWGNGMFVAVMDGAIMRSADGVTWNLKTMPTGYGRDITFGNGYFYICGGGGVKRSADAETWMDLNLGVSATWRTIAAGGGHVVVLGGKCVVSDDDGLTFAEYPIPTGGWEESIFVDGYFTAIDGIDGNILTEADNIDWERRTTPNFATRSLSAGNGTVIAVGSRVMVARVIDIGAALINANGPNGSNPYATAADVLRAKLEAIETAVEESTLYWGGIV
jgi:hypothetical protein